MSFFEKQIRVEYDSAPVSPIADALEQVRRWIIYIQTEWIDREQQKRRRVNGTGFILGTAHLKSGQEGWLLISAAHCFEKRQAAEVTVRVTTDVQQRPEPRSMSMDFPGDWAGVPGFQLGTPTPYDVAGLCIPKAIEGKPLIEGAGPQLYMENPSKILKPGTPVAWAGYPNAAIGYLGGHPSLCYYEGKIAGVAQKTAGLLEYFVDGHSTNGVSGGPVWRISPATGRTVIVGIIRGYVANEAAPGFADPGFALVSSINSMVLSLAELNSASEAPGA